MYRATNAYRNVAVTTASPAQVLDQLIERLLRDCDDAAKALAAGDVGGRVRAVHHAMEIITALSHALEVDVAPEVCEGLGKLYDYAGRRLFEVNARVDARPLAEVKKLFVGLREAFQAASQPVGMASGM